MCVWDNLGRPQPYWPFHSRTSCSLGILSAKISKTLDRSVFLPWVLQASSELSSTFVDFRCLCRSRLKHSHPSPLPNRQGTPFEARGNELNHRNGNWFSTNVALPTCPLAPVKAVSLSQPRTGMLAGGLREIKILKFVYAPLHPFGQLDSKLF